MDINVIDKTTGQVTTVDITTQVFTNVQSQTVLSTEPADYNVLVQVPVANGMFDAKPMTKATLTASLSAAIAGKLSTPTGTTSQYMRGDGTLATLPSAVDITGKSDKSQFTAVSTLAAHGRSNGATTNPTNSKTDYNVVTTLLGTLTDGLNQTNTAQNTIATNLNALATQFNALLTWLGTSKDTVNSLRLAGAT